MFVVVVITKMSEVMRDVCCHNTLLHLPCVSLCSDLAHVFSAKVSWYTNMLTLAQGAPKSAFDMVAEHIVIFHQKVEEGCVCEGGWTHGGKDAPVGAMEVKVGQAVQVSRVHVEDKMV